MLYRHPDWNIAISSIPHFGCVLVHSNFKVTVFASQIDFFANERVGRCDENKEKPTDQQNARYMLQIWSEDDDDPSVENLSSMLESLGMLEALKLLKST